MQYILSLSTTERNEMSCLPAGLFVVRDELIDNRRDAHEPHWNGTVDEWRAGPSQIQYDKAG